MASIGVRRRAATVGVGGISVRVVPPRRSHLADGILLLSCCEQAYDVLKTLGGLDNEELAAVFTEWNQVRDRAAVLGDAVWATH